MRFGSILGRVHLSHRPRSQESLHNPACDRGPRLLLRPRHRRGMAVSAEDVRQRPGGLPALLRGFAATAGNLRLA